MNFPADLKYTKDHEWVRMDGEFAYIGITDFAQHELGDIVFVEIETEGDTLDAEAVFGTVEAVKTVSDLFMPLGGEVVQFNKELESNPQYVNEDPYGKGWIVKVEIANPADLNSLMDAAAYEAHLS